MTEPGPSPSIAAPAMPASSTLRDTVIVLSTTMLGLVGSLATQSCLAWLLEPAGRGAFAVCATFAAVAPVLVGLATERGAQYQVMARRFSVARATSVTFVTVTTAAVLAAVIGWVLIGSSLEFFQKADRSAFRLSLLLMPLIGLGAALNFLLVAVGRFRTIGIINLAAIGTNLLGTLVFVGWLGAGVQGALWALIGSYGATVAMQMRTLHRIGGGFERPRASDFGRVVSYGLRYYVARVGNMVNVQIGMLVMAWLGTPEQIGLFAAASVLIGRVMVVPDSLDTALQPRVGSDASGKPALVATASRTSVAIVGAALATLLATSGVLVPLLLSPAFAGAIPLLWLMAPGLWIKSATKPMTAYFIGMNRPEVVSLATASELAGNVIGMPLLFAHAGLPGAALATSIGCTIGSLVMLIAFTAVSGLGPLAIWTPRRADVDRLRGAWHRFWHRRGSATEPSVPAEVATKVLEVAYVVDNLGGGGAQRQAVELAVRLRREREIATRIVCYRRFDGSKRDPYTARLAEAGVPVHLVEKGAKLDPTFPLRLGRALSGCDVAHAFMPLPGLWTWLALRTLRRSRRPVLVAAERCMPSQNTRIDRAIQGFVYRRAAVVTVNARPALQELATQLGLPADRLRYLPNGIDLAAWERDAAGPPPWLLEPGRFHVGLIGRLSAQKNQALLLAALARLSSEERSIWRAWLVGVGADTDERDLDTQLREQIRRESLEEVVHLVPPTDRVAALLRQLDLLVLPSQFEGFPNVVLEAMALGTLVVATPVGDVPSLLEPGVSGLMVRPGDADDLLRGLRAAQALEPAERARLTRAARLHVEKHYRIEAVADAYLELYQTVQRRIRPLGGPLHGSRQPEANP